MGANQVSSTKQQFTKDFEAIAEYSRDMVCIHDADGTYLYVNPASKEITGYTPEELLGKNPYDFFHPEDQESIRNGSHHMAVLGDDTVRAQYRFIHKNTQHIWLETLTRPIKDAEGNVVRLHTTSRDVTEAHQQQVRLKEQNNLLSMAQQLSNMGPWEVNVVDQSVTWSPQIKRIHDLEPDHQLVMSDVLNFYVGESRQLAEEKLGRILQHGEGFDIVLRTKTAKGRLIWTRVIGEVQLVGGKAKRVYGVCQDVTAEHTHRKELQNLVDILTTRNRQASDLTRMLQHNLRGPLGTIRVVASVMAERKVVEDESIDLIQKSVITLLDRLENISESPHHSPSPTKKPTTPVDLEKCLAHARESLNQWTIDSNHDIQSDFNAITSIKYPEIYLDSYFYNFLSNALKYKHPDRPALVKVRCYPSDDEVVLSFVDNGMGIDLAKNGHRLFQLHQRFHTEAQGQEKPIEGSGMGLFMCKNQVESLGGRIEVESKEGVGSEFRLVLGTVQELC